MKVYLMMILLLTMITNYQFELLIIHQILNYVKQFKNNLKAFAQCLYFRCSEYISEAPHIENFSRFIAANIRPVMNNN